MLNASEPVRIVYLTAGAAGMYCGSCMHDNTLARALIARGLECLLVPTYTPIRTDENDISDQHVFFGGINIYLEQKVPLWRRLPAGMTRWLDNPRLLRLATRRTSSASPKLLGELTVSMLQGMRGRQRLEVCRLCDWLDQHARPDVVVLSNFLIGGCIPELRRRLGCKVVVTLQGDDIFLDYLPSRYRNQAIELMSALAIDVDAFVVNSEFYRQKMASMLGLSDRPIRVMPLGIDVAAIGGEHGPRAILESEQPATDSKRPLRLGYLARIDPAKGLDRLVDGFIELHRRRKDASSEDATQIVELHVAGWLGQQHLSYAQAQWQRLESAGLGHRYTYHGSPDLQGKIEFLRNLDLFCVPTQYEEPKGLYALEAMAAGVPSILPRHGVFPEWQSSEGNVAHLVTPGDSIALAEAIERLVTDAHQRRELAQRAFRFVDRSHSIQAMAGQMHELLIELANPSKVV